MAKGVRRIYEAGHMPAQYGVGIRHLAEAALIMVVPDAAALMQHLTDEARPALADFAAGIATVDWQIPCGCARCGSERRRQSYALSPSGLADQARPLHQTKRQVREWPNTDCRRTRPVPTSPKSKTTIATSFCLCNRSPAKSATVTGMRLAPAPVISMESWAWANPAVNRVKARKIRREIRYIAVIFTKLCAILLFKRLVFDIQDARKLWPESIE